MVLLVSVILQRTVVSVSGTRVIVTAVAVVKGKDVDNVAITHISHVDLCFLYLFIAHCRLCPEKNVLVRMRVTVKTAKVVMMVVKI